jgi:hypothetical protein
LKKLLMLLALVGCAGPTAEPPRPTSPAPVVSPGPPVQAKPTPSPTIEKGTLEVTVTGWYPPKVSSWTFELGNAAGGVQYRATLEQPTVRIDGLPATGWVLRTHPQTYYLPAPLAQTVVVRPNAVTRATIHITATHP